MSSKTKIHWPTTFTFYFLAASALAVITIAVRSGSPVSAVKLMLTGAFSLTLLIVFLFSATFIVRHFYRGVGNKLFSIMTWLVTKFWHAVLAWLGMGLTIFGVAELVEGVKPSTSFGAALSGPFAIMLYPRRLFIVVLAFVWSAALAEFLHRTKLANHHGGRGAFVEAARNVRRTFGTDYEVAPAEAPTDAHFAEITPEVSRYVIVDQDRAKRVPFGVAQLAPDWGGKKSPVELGLPTEGSAVWVGIPGSGKGLALQRMLLSVEKEDKQAGVLPTKIITLSVKARDLAAPTVPWLRSQGLDVGIWDLTGKTSATTEYGDPIRWSPIMASYDYDSAKRTALRLVQSGREPESRARDEFWLTQATLLLGPTLYAAFLTNKDYETALSWVQSWTDPRSNEVDLCLSGKGPDATDALRAWQDTRKLLLDKEGDTDWKEKHGLGAGAGTGLSIQATMSGLMIGLATKAAYEATRSPNFDPKAWVRAPGSSAVFLIGNTQEKSVTRSLLATVIHELLTEATDFARDHDDERLPYRLVVLGDELANLAPIPDLQEFFSTARSTRTQIIAVFQSYGQIEDVYSAEVARVLFDAATAAVVLSGIKDQRLIGALSAIGGAQQVELNEGAVTARPLIEGHDVTSLRAPDWDAGTPGQGLMIMSGAIARIEVPFWSLEKKYRDRGVVPAQFAESTEALRHKNRTRREKLADNWTVIRSHRTAHRVQTPTPVSQSDPRRAKPLTPRARPLTPQGVSPGTPDNEGRS